MSYYCTVVFCFSSLLFSIIKKTALVADFVSKEVKKDFCTLLLLLLKDDYVSRFLFLFD